MIQWTTIRRAMRVHAPRFIIYPLLALFGSVLYFGLNAWEKAIDHDLVMLSSNRSFPSYKAANGSQITIEEPLFGARLNSSDIPVSGHAPPLSSVSLWMNGEKIANTTANNEGRFQFDAVHLDNEGNLIQLAYTKKNGQGGYSPAILVYRNQLDRPGYHYVQRSPDNLVRGNKRYREIALTFDGGHTGENVDALLELVERYHVPVTIFLTGDFIKANPSMTLRLAASPWVEIGNHTVNHPHLTTYAINHRQFTRPNVTPTLLRHQLAETARRFQHLTHQAIRPLWRAPYGEHNQEIRSWASSLGYTHISWTTTPSWTLDTLDWIDNPNNPLFRPGRQIIDNLIELARKKPNGINGGIILLHLGNNRSEQDQPIHYLPDFITACRRLGYWFVNISTMLRHLQQPTLQTAGVPAHLPFHSAPR